MVYNLCKMRSKLRLICVQMSIDHLEKKKFINKPPIVILDTR